MGSQKDILCAALAESVFDQCGNQVSVVGDIEFLQDDVVGKYVKIAEASQLLVKNSEFAVGYGDFSLDCWVNRLGKNASVGTFPWSGCGGSLFPDNRYQNVMMGQGYGRGQSLVKVELIPEGVWAHYAMVRKDGILYGFVNGVLQGTVNAAGQNADCETLHVNGWYEGQDIEGANCYKHVRFSNFARWTDDFTPPDAKGDGGQPGDPDELNLHILLDVNETVDLTGYIHPVAPNVPQLIWSSDNEAIASIDQNGKVTGNAVGVTRIHVKTPDDSWSAFVRVIVEEEGVSDLRLSILLEPGEACRLKGIFVPNGTDKPVVWSSSNTSVATVASNGKVTAVALGEAIITVQTVDGSLSDYIYVTVVTDKN